MSHTIIFYQEIGSECLFEVKWKFQGERQQEDPMRVTGPPASEGHKSEKGSKHEKEYKYLAGMLDQVFSLMTRYVI